MPAAVRTPVVINVGGQTRSVSGTTNVTAAEYVAATQVATTGRQSIQLSTTGAANGGFFDATAFSLSGLVVPAGVTAARDFATGGAFSLTGDLVNSGKFYAVSTSRTLSTATITADNITNFSGGLLTTVLPPGSSLLAGFLGLSTNLNLALNATRNVLNQGIISSAGSLSVTAGGAIVNGSAASAGTSSAATMSAVGALNLAAPSISNQGNLTSLNSNVNVQTNALTNTGLMSAMQGSISLSPWSGSSIQILNTSGSISARDSVNFSIAGSANNAITLLGGVVSANAASFSPGPTGTVTVSLTDLPKNLSFNAKTVNLSISNATNGLVATGLSNASGGSLNYRGSGDVQIDGFNTNGGGITVNTTGSIVVGTTDSPANLNTSGGGSSNAGSVSLNSSGGTVTVGNVVTSSSGAGNAGNISLVASGDVTASNLNASGLAGHSGDIVIQAGTSGTGSASVHDVVTPGGSISLGSENTNISGNVNIGDGSVHWQVPDNGLYVVDFAKLIQYGGSSVSVGGATFKSDIVMTKDCNGCLGSVTNVAIQTAGKYIATGTTTTLLDSSTFSITADGGISTGSVTAGGVRFATTGLLTVDGNLNGKATSVSLQGGDISVAPNTRTTAFGGDVWMVAANDINVGPGTTITSTASPDGKTGGQIGIFAGASNFDMAAQLASMQAARNGKELLTLPANGAGWDSATNTVKMSGGSNMIVSFPAGADKTIANSSFTLNGGVLYIDPPGSNNVNISGANFVVVGPAVVATPTGGGTTGGGTTTGGTTSGGTAGSGSTDSSTINLNGGTLFGGISTNTLTGITGGFVSSTATPTDQTTNSSSNSNSVNLNTLDSSSAQPTDTLTTRGREPMRAAIYCAPPGKLKENEALTEDNWIIASNKCQPFSFEGADGSIIVGTGPAIFAPTNNKTLLLKEGKLLIIAGDGMIVVRTPMSNVTIPVNSAATVEFSQQGLTRVTGLAGGKASVSVTRQGETIILTAAPGEQLVLAEDSVGEGEITCIPDVPNKKNESWLVRLAGVRGEKFSFDRAEMVAREGLLNCTLSCFTKLQQSMIDQIRKSMMMESPPTQLKSMLPPRQHTLISRASSNDHLMAVGLGQILDLTVPDLMSLKCASALVKYTPGANISIVAPNVLQLRQGDVLVSTDSATTVNAGRYTVRLEPHTVATINMRGDHVVVRNVHESKQGSVRIMTPEAKCAAASVGQEVIAGTARTSVSSVLSEEAVGRRRLRHLEVSDKTALTTSEVSVLSLIQNTNILSQMARSEHPDDKEILHHIIKSAAALQIVTQRHGNYSIIGH
jgi:hypothetical protein